MPPGTCEPMEWGWCLETTWWPVSFTISQSESKQISITIFDRGWWKCPILTLSKTSLMSADRKTPSNSFLHHPSTTYKRLSGAVSVFHTFLGYALNTPWWGDERDGLNTRLCFSGVARFFLQCLLIPAQRCHVSHLNSISLASRYSSQICHLYHWLTQGSIKW